MKPMEMLSNGKAPGSDAIPAEVYKDGGDHLVHRMTKLFQLMWNKEQIPKNTKLPQLFVCTRGREIDTSVTTIGVLLC